MLQPMARFPVGILWKAFGIKGGFRHPEKFLKVIASLLFWGQLVTPTRRMHFFGKLHDEPVSTSATWIGFRSDSIARSDRRGEIAVGEMY